MFILQQNKIITPASLYVLINIFVSAVGFARSFLFMKWLDMGELGIISLVQTIIMFLGLFQFGLINGGYRIFALDKADQQRDINNVLFTYFGILASAALLFWGVLMAVGIQIIISNDLMFAALVCGLLTLIMNWLTNTLIGKRLIKDINQINISAVIISLALLPLVAIWGTYGAVIALAAQPLVFIIVTLIRNKELRPTAWNFDLTLIKYILSFGFIPFLASIFGLLNLQIERWNIADLLGTEALGEFYLVFLYTTLFTLIPASLLNIFFPKAVYAYENNQISEFKSILKKHVVLLGIYLAVIVIFTFVGLQFFINLLLPMHSIGIKYVYFFLPGLLALVFCDPMAIIFNSTVRLKPILWSGLIAVILNVMLIFGAEKIGIFTLKNMSIIKSLVNILPFLIYLSYTVVNYRIIFNMKTQ